MGGPLHKYRYRSERGETVLKLNDADAARLGLGEDDIIDTAAESSDVQTLSLPEDNPGAETAARDEAAAGTQKKKAASAPNKARRTAATKAPGTGSPPRRSAPPAVADAPGQGDGQQTAPRQDDGDGGPGGGD
ncbi:hypothetical protein OG413_15560 [Streptomyces sp. NBC_01433]|uniref:hypothetical protein n=1 Tax=Streptomyces sp. NBC_01433 TaxID=2903864 RepID=UPI0022599605|nr:hypothetical protein [Streptomyces sp. NBC_01433]MCX4676701.1 hypothetical protein [Streptomyces sp. NBC_01433]